METQIDCSVSSRGDFPGGFIFGAATSAYQIEGGAEDRNDNIWDTFTREHKGMIRDKSDGKIADLSYNLDQLEEDVRCLKNMGADAYRFSISWSRIMPQGNRIKGPSSKGIEYYNRLIDMLVKNGLKPVATLFHFDVPQALENAYGGFLSSRIVDDFCDFADTCFKLFGDRVTHWITFNEPWSFCYCGYALGSHAPGRRTPEYIKEDFLRNSIAHITPHRSYLSKEVSNKTPVEGDSGTEPYKVAHHMLLAHAAAVKLYRLKYQSQPCQMGKIGITLVSIWTLPYSELKEDREAAQRQLDFMFGWFMDPLTSGQYPQIMQDLVRPRLKNFTPDESKDLIGSFDFLGLNYYTASYAKNKPYRHVKKPSYVTDSQVELTPFDKDGVPIGPQAASNWLYVYPKGMWEILLYTKRKYHNPVIIITENGVDEENSSIKTLKEACEDPNRIYYIAHHLSYVKKAIMDGVKVKGYFVWSLLDNFEWNQGYTSRFGLHYIDYNDSKLTRHPKNSAEWFKKFLQK